MLKDSIYSGKKRTKRAVESGIQRTFFKAIRCYPSLDKLVFSIPNAGKRGPREGHRMKLEGMKCGVPDCFIAIPSGSFAGLWIEFKSDRGILSVQQKEVINNLKLAGYDCQVFRAWDVAFDYIKEYIKNTPFAIN